MVELCRESLKDQDMTEEEVQDELTVIKVQDAYVKQLQGQFEQAKNAYEDIIKSKPSDASALAVAANNVISITGTGGADLFDTAKKLKLATSSKVAGKLTSAQQRAINLNNSLLLMFQKKFDECREAIAQVSVQFPDSDIPPLMTAALLYKEKKYDQAIGTLQDYMSKYGKQLDKTMRTHLTLAQLHIYQGNFEQAIQVLNTIAIRVCFSYKYINFV